MEKTYDSSKFEDLIYADWEKSGFFNPDKLPGKRKDSFSMVMPPPNVTGTLHVGHAVMLALQDLMIRFNRMSGKLALWIPGTDHAAIATATKVEKLLAQKGESRQSLGRKKFLEEVKKFAEESKSVIRKQIRKMGSSCDWSREAYTLDESRTKAVRTVFKMMYDDGLIYRGYRIVNWCPRCSSTLADDEVIYKSAKEKLYWIKYGPFILATARPETKLGDTAVAVHPKDPRYKKHIGKKYKIPGALGDFEIVVVADRAVDMKFGSGAIKVTPAHDFTDFEIAERHGVPMKQVIGEDGRMMSNTGKYAGLTTAEARREIVKDMGMMGLIEKIEDYEHNLAVCYRCEHVIEPLPKLQWFIAVNQEFKFRQSKNNPVKGLKNGQKMTLKKLMQHAVTSGQIKIIPERFYKTYFQWVDNLRDWNISRQIWFGHRVPVWYRSTDAHGKSDGTPSESRGVEIYVGVDAPQGKGWVQDSDTLDTWFSSGLWTFSTLGWPKDNKDLRAYHPTSVLETGYDILFFWIARMILMSTYALGEVPFHNVYLHGLVRDEEGRKMSKSLGNIIDPLDVSAKYGTDAVRLSLILGAAPGGDSRIWEEKIAGFRNFTNKLWNISRYILGAVAPNSKFQIPNSKFNPKTLADKWILSRFSEVSKSVTSKLEKFEFSSAGEELRDFTWGELADWYLEISKIQLTAYGLRLTANTKEILLYLLQNILKLWHPFMPFVTEAIWKESFAKGEKDFLMIQDWPNIKTSFDAKAVRDFRLVQDIITAIRNIRAEQSVEPKVKTGLSIFAGSLEKVLKAEEAAIATLGRSEKIEFLKSSSKPKGAVGAVAGKVNVFVHLKEADLEARKSKLKEELEEAEKYLAVLGSKLQNKDFVSRAPAAVVEAEKEKLRAQTERIEKLKKELK
ncbi:valine--tRNA ligase [Candidatus Uhrbacteria bacterium]|nr:valine--tRNA ligase [Candidatus Uhrbacteria bacterium]